MNANAARTSLAVNPGGQTHRWTTALCTLCLMLLMSWPAGAREPLDIVVTGLSGDPLSNV